MINKYAFLSRVAEAQNTLSISRAIYTEQHCFQNWMSKFICYDFMVEITYNNRIKCGPGGILNRSEPRNNMVYASYNFYLIHLVFIFIISQTCAHHHSLQSSHYQGMTVTGIGPFLNIAWSAQKISNLGSWMDWWAVRLVIWLRKDHFCQHFDTLITFSCWVIQGTNLSPCSSPTFLLARTSCTKSHTV